MEVMSAKEAADKWGISQRRVAVLCSENRIENAQLLGNMWLIPINAEKPIDGRSKRYIETDKSVRPFLKWAGGKGQLLNNLSKYYPFDEGKITKYAEPFVGGGAVLFDILNKYSLEGIYICDNNAELMNAYKMVRDSIEEVIYFLSMYQQEFIPLDDNGRKMYYSSKRDRYNSLSLIRSDLERIEKAALMIFLNRTCFNGLYRVNRKGQFNVPMGSYKTPLICDENNLRAVSDKLQDVIIACGDFRDSESFIDENTFVYFDPPYRPLNQTSSFTAYTEDNFDDNMQIALAEFAKEMSNRGAKVVVSNSDPKNVAPDDNFFDDLYNTFNICRVEANRMINSNSQARGKIKELLISNF
ncbi:MAG: DNA adenine methylase [Ruminococcaceae bacterium]|nr:DNA adenine methylase [Oscillospiraceae bacterium]